MKSLKSKIFAYVLAPVIAVAMAFNIGFLVQKLNDPHRHDELKSVLAKNGAELKEVVKQNGSKQKTQTIEAILVASGKEQTVHVFRVNDGTSIKFWSPELNFKS